MPAQVMDDAGCVQPWDGDCSGWGDLPPVDEFAEVVQYVSQLDAEKAPLTLTYGIELEFVLVGDIDFPEGEQPRYACDGPITLVAKALLEPVTAKCAGCGKLHTFNLRVALPPYRKDFSKKSWMVKTDCSVTLKGKANFDVPQTGMELVSPVFVKGKTVQTMPSLTDPTHTHSIIHEQEISLMLTRLHDAFNTPEGARGARKHNRILVNSTCGLHIHVGNRADGLPVRTAKNLTAIYTACERQIDSLLNVDRIGGTMLAVTPIATMDPKTEQSRIHGHTYNRSNSELFITATYNLLHEEYYGVERDEFFDARYPRNRRHEKTISDAAHSYEPADMITLIMAAPDIMALRDIAGGWEHRNDLNLQNLHEIGKEPYERPNHGKSTVEFRAAAGTLEPAEALSWIDVVTRAVETAHYATDAQIRKLLDDALRNPNYSAMDLLKALQCRKSTMVHYKHVLGIAEPDDIPYAQLRVTRQSLAAARIEDDTKDIRLQAIQEQGLALNADSVRKRISDKFKLGGYGRFPRAYLDAYLPPLSEAEKQRLTSGTVVPSHPDVQAIVEEVIISEQSTPASGMSMRADAGHTPLPRSHPPMALPSPESDVSSGAADPELQEEEEPRWRAPPRRRVRVRVHESDSETQSSAGASRPKQTQNSHPHCVSQPRHGEATTAPATDARSLSSRSSCRVHWEPAGEVTVKTYRVTNPDPPSSGESSPNAQVEHQPVCEAVAFQALQTLQVTDLALRAPTAGSKEPFTLPFAVVPVLATKAPLMVRRKHAVPQLDAASFTAFGQHWVKKRGLSFSVPEDEL